MDARFGRLYRGTEGRIGRREFWMGMMGLAIAGVVLSVLLRAIFIATARPHQWLQLFFPLLILVSPLYAVMAKRFQDRGKPAKQAWIVIGASLLFPFMGFLGWTGDPLSLRTFGQVVGLIYLALVAWFVVELGFLPGMPIEKPNSTDPLSWL